MFVCCLSVKHCLSVWLKIWFQVEDGFSDVADWTSVADQTSFQDLIHHLPNFSMWTCQSAGGVLLWKDISDFLFNQTHHLFSNFKSLLTQIGEFLGVLTSFLIQAWAGFQLSYFSPLSLVRLWFLFHTLVNLYEQRDPLIKPFLLLSVYQCGQRTSVFLSLWDVETKASQWAQKYQAKAGSANDLAGGAVGPLSSETLFLELRLSEKSEIAKSAAGAHICDHFKLN